MTYTITLSDEELRALDVVVDHGLFFLEETVLDKPPGDAATDEELREYAEAELAVRVMRDLHPRFTALRQEVQHVHARSADQP